MTIPKRTGLIITPFHAGAARVADTVKRALSDAGLVPITVQQLSTPGSLAGETILDALQKADVIIADVSRQSPNVMYELGFAHALRKPTIMIISKDAAHGLPSDLTGYLYISYDESNLSSLRENIARLVLQVAREESGGDE
jgi:predicted nucleotide-binding protein